MPHLTQERAIKQYWEIVKDKYPNISFEKFTKICKAPFEYIKRSMRIDTLPIILIKYLGKIRPYATRVNSQLKFLSKKTDEKNIEKTKFLIEYLKELEDYDNSKRAEEGFYREVILTD